MCPFEKAFRDKQKNRIWTPIYKREKKIIGLLQVK